MDGESSHTHGAEARVGPGRSSWQRIGCFCDFAGGCCCPSFRDSPVHTSTQVTFSAPQPGSIRFLSHTEPQDGVKTRAKHFTDLKEEEEEQNT
ncbi:hypothetical protein AALO_G00233750 [Alosa alosa]|uniref:Uncharacterized protein n=1 Tax=Alosa alosa TaxID=278164 RepID=A0AAV6FXR5_9TELE|nr:hypothetical protein AALO_G00233750 [Alosa alosa]